MEDLQSVKEEALTFEDIENQADGISLFPLESVQAGLVEIESSSGSSSESSSSSSDEEVFRPPSSFSNPRYTRKMCLQIVTFTGISRVVACIRVSLERKWL